MADLGKGSESAEAGKRKLGTGADEAEVNAASA